MAGKTERKGRAGDRRERIVEAALDLYRRHGVAQTRMNEIARKARVDPPLLHYYFRDPDELALAVIAKVLESLKERSLREASKHADDSRREMLEYVRAPILWAEENPELMTLWMYFYYLASRSGRFRELNDSIRRGGRERISGMIYRGIERGEFAVEKGKTVAAVATEIQAMITGSAILFATEGETKASVAIAQLEGRTLALLGGRKSGA
jgi:AcrR family transcriptional regulator